MKKNKKTTEKVVSPNPEKGNGAELLKSYQSFSLIVRVGILIFMGLGFINLMALNAVATRGFSLEKIKTERFAVMRELEQIDIDLATPLSLYALKSSVKIQNMPEIEEKEYLFVRYGRLAQNQEENIVPKR